MSKYSYAWLSMCNNTFPNTPFELTLKKLKFGYLGDSVGNVLEYYTEENVYKKLISDTEQYYNYWDQQCRGELITYL